MTSCTFPDRQRWKTELKKNDAVARTIIYADNYEKITENGVTRHFYYLHGADGLAAVHVKQAWQTDATYYAHTDHLGSIVKLTNPDGDEVFKASYDAWGKQTVTYSALNFYRGYTGHEHLPEFGLVNMNGRMYDPLLGRMLSPDPYVPDPYFSQDYNRYSYARNNPLVYTDPSGEFWHVVVGALVGGIVNLVANWDNIDGFWQGVATFGVGAGAGAAVAATGGAAGAGLGAIVGVGAAGGAATSATNSIVAQTGKNFEGIENVSWSAVGVSSVVGGVAGAAGAGVGYWAASSSTLTNSISSPLLRSAIVSPLASGASHVAGGTTANLIEGQNLGDAFTSSFKGVEKSMAIGLGVGVATTVGVSYANGVNPLTGKAINQPTQSSQTSDFFEGTKYSSKVLRQMDNLEDPFHSFSRSVDGYANKFGNHYMEMGNDGHLYHHLKIPGNYMGKTGVFHYIKDSNGLINHRLFEVIQIKK